MATKNSSEITVEQKLRALYDLQIIHSKLDEIRNTRGELPVEVEDLENDIAGLEKRIENLKEDIDSLNVDIKEKNEVKKNSQALIKKYTKQLDDIRNDREHTSLTKEIEYQELEIELAEKRIGEFKFKISKVEEKIADVQEKLDGYKKHLKHKKSELNSLIKETEKEEAFLNKKVEEFSELIDNRLLSSYNRIRTASKNGLAVVSVERGAAVGSYFTIPPQKMVEIAMRKKILIDEHSGKILVDEVLAQEEVEKVDNLLLAEK
ncbi:MAG: hypothetical protein H6604_08500 [Flavobacteriales bacterium]|nr:hypothetical protein [Flavobacteriales bacterium]